MNSCTHLSSRLSKLAVASTRRFSMERLTAKDLEIVKNPSDEQINAFQQMVGGFNDIKLLKETMKDRYRLFLLCLKDSNKVVSGTHSITFKSLHGSDDFQHFGLSFQPDNCYDLLPHLMHEMCQELGAVNMNSGGCVDSKNAAVWRKVLHTKVRGPTYYVSHYKADEVFNPDLEFDDVIVKKFAEVPVEHVVNYDNSIFPYERKEFLLAKFKGGVGRVAYDKSGNVIGIGLVSTDGSSGNCDIGPMYCDSRNTAQAIFQNILRELPLKDLNEIRIRCSDKFEDSATWVRPFLRRRHEMTPFAHIKFNRVIPAGLNLSKVFVNSNPSSAPC
ncbi:unnamed protein product [Caenorhabditis sp. 36 PRJEB53466]|nr:unnamed protein product [Caenorhabditis sp. 36 PRJEB53466]